VPQVITQALAMEKPVIATSIGAIGEVIKPGVSGLLVPPRDSGALAQGILSLMENMQYARTLASQGRQLVEAQYSLTRMLDRIESLYGRLLQDRRKAS
jgi:glycosyltransferase involved in cell wall biosynthesis